MITLKEFLAEPQTMYDGGMVQHMSEGGQPSPIPMDRLRRTERAITEAKGTDKLWGPEVREYVEGIRKGDIDDPDFLRVYEATQKGLGQYTEEEVKSMGMEDPFLPAATKRTTPTSRYARGLLSKSSDDVPLVALGLDPTRIASDDVPTPLAGFYKRTSTNEAPFIRSFMKEKEAAADRPYLYEEGDVIRSEAVGGQDTDTILFHEAAHRGLEILRESMPFELPRLTKNLTVATKNTSKEDLIDKFHNEEIWVRLLQQQHYPSSTEKQQELNTKINNKFFRTLQRRGIINSGEKVFNVYGIKSLLREYNIQQVLNLLYKRTRI